MIRFSRTVSSMSSVSSCGTTPRRARIFGPSCTGSMPRMRSVPPEGGETQPIIRIVELLPAPLGPRKPNASPRCTAKSTPSTATMRSNSLRRPRASIRGAPALMQCTLARRALQLGGGAFERLGELGELVLVGERQLDTTGADLCVEAGQQLQRVAHPCGERRVDGGCTNPRRLLRARPFRPLL